MRAFFFLLFLAALTVTGLQASAAEPAATAAPMDLAPVIVTPGPVAVKIEIFKALRQLRVLDAEGKVMHSYKIVLGWAPAGPKLEEGDGKTPEGSYTIDAHNENSAYHKSLHISYPNSDDLARAKKNHVKPGGAIFIHGKPNFKAWMFWKYNHSNDWTNGCIALANSDMNELWKLVPDGTPIVINP